VRTLPSTICAERTLFLAIPTAKALPVRARNSAKQLITRAGEGRNELVLLVLRVIGDSFRLFVNPDGSSFRSIVLLLYGPQG
jgi:hypothetical protein